MRSVKRACIQIHSGLRQPGEGFNLNAVWGKSWTVSIIPAGR